MFQKLSQLKMKNDNINDIQNENMFNEMTEENLDKEILESLTNNIEFINKDLQSNKSQKSKFKQFKYHN
jgi:hypothetical protein